LGGQNQEMEQAEHSKRRREWPLVVAIVVALVCAPPAIYLGGYFCAGTYEQGYWVGSVNEMVVFRTYPATWMQSLFTPAGRLEKRLMGYDVVIDSTLDDEMP
jgi:hypothetical protein